MKATLLFAVVVASLLFFGCIKEDNLPPNTLPPNKLNDALNMAIDKNNSSLCSSSGLDKADERRCYFNYGSNVLDMNACEKADLTSQCYLNIAQKTSNASICERINETSVKPKEQTKNLCYYSIGIVRKDGSLCEKMTDDVEFHCQPCEAGSECYPCPSPATKKNCLEQTSG